MPGGGPPGAPGGMPGGMPRPIPGGGPIPVQGSNIVIKGKRVSKTKRRQTISVDASARYLAEAAPFLAGRPAAVRRVPSCQEAGPRDRQRQEP